MYQPSLFDYYPFENTILWNQRMKDEITLLPPLVCGRKSSRDFSTHLFVNLASEVPFSRLLTSFRASFMSLLDLPPYHVGLFERGGERYTVLKKMGSFLAFSIPKVNYVFAASTLLWRKSFLAAKNDDVDKPGMPCACQLDETPNVFSSLDHCDYEGSFDNDVDDPFEKNPSFSCFFLRCFCSMLFRIT